MRGGDGDRLGLETLPTHTGSILSWVAAAVVMVGSSRARHRAECFRESGPSSSQGDGDVSTAPSYRWEVRRRAGQSPAQRHRLECVRAGI